MTTDGTSEKPNWSDLPQAILELIVGRLQWTDRIRIRAVCKAWSVPNRHVPAIVEPPWAFKFHWSLKGNGKKRKNVKYNKECRLLDPFSRGYIIKGKESRVFSDAKITIPCASVYGWVLYQYLERQKSFFMYSPFTDEVIKLPCLRKTPPVRTAATFSLSATSPKCDIFVSWIGSGGKKIYINLCSPGDTSWKTFEFNCSDKLIYPVDATYINGIFYCVFQRGQLGAFDVKLEKWTMLNNHPLPGHSFINSRLVASDGDLRLLSSKESLNILKFDFPETRWVYENDYLNNNVLFIGCTSFSTPAVGETSQLANTVFSSPIEGHPQVRSWGDTSCSQLPHYLNCVEATEYERNCEMVWIELPLGGIWRANDLINALRSREIKHLFRRFTPLKCL